jgi:hypothetical protein
MELGENGIVKEFPEIKKNRNISLFIIAGIFLTILLIGMVWTNIIFSDKDFGSTITNEIITPEVPVDIDAPVNVDNQYNNNFTLNIALDSHITEMIAKEVIKIINNETNYAD